MPLPHYDHDLLTSTSIHRDGFKERNNLFPMAVEYSTARIFSAVSRIISKDGMTESISCRLASLAVRFRPHMHSVREARTARILAVLSSCTRKSSGFLSSPIRAEITVHRVGKNTFFRDLSAITKRNFRFTRPPHTRNGLTTWQAGNMWRAKLVGCPSKSSGYLQE